MPPGRHRAAGLLAHRPTPSRSLTGALLRAGLVDEIGLLVHPYLAGTRMVRVRTRARREEQWAAPYGSGSTSAWNPRPVRAETLDGAVIWLRYRRWLTLYNLRS